ncbi:isomerase [Clostridia bacterium]|nr:isomerase [Clostridia bacterium]
MNTHEMKLRPEPFEKMRQGIKTVEVRLNDEKRKAVKVGDYIVFSQTDSGEKLTTEVKGLYPYPTFVWLFRAFPATLFGCEESTTEAEFVASMGQYYGEDEERANGVLGIGIRVR